MHLAAAVGVGQSMYEIERYTSVNAIGAAVVLEEVLAVRDRLAKLVVASSMSIYGEGLYRCPAEDTMVAPEPRPTDQLARRAWEVECPSCGAELVPTGTTEAKPLQPTSVYAVGKRDHEEMFLACGRAYGIPTTALRFFNVYGPRQALSNPYTGVAAIFASRLMNGRPPVIFEDGLQSRDFVHVSDIVQGIVVALDPRLAPLVPVNLGTGAQTTVLDVAHALASALSVDVELEATGRVSRRGHPSLLRVDRPGTRGARIRADRLLRRRHGGSRHMALQTVRRGSGGRGDRDLARARADRLTG